MILAEGDGAERTGRGRQRAGRGQDDTETVVSTQGRPISPDDEVRGVDDADRDVADGEFGRLITRGPYTIRGYWRAPDHGRRAFTGDGFYRTGDVVRRTPTGHLVVEGRAKDQVNRGGEKTAPEAVENVVPAHPSVRDVSVVAVPDSYLGERSLAYVILREGSGPPRPADVERFVRQSGIAAFVQRDIQAFVVADFSRADHDMVPRWAAGRCAVVTTTDALLGEV